MQYANSIDEVETISTGTFIDRLIPGIPRKKITEIFGDSGIGKSTLCFQIVAEAQAKGLKCLWGDTEWYFNSKYAKELGVNLDTLGIIRETSGEDVLSAIEEEISTGKYDLVVLDSIGGLTPRAELEKGQEGKVIGGQAGMVARFCRTIVPALYLENTALVVINHSFVDLMSGALKTSGGRKLEYHRSISIRLKSAGLWIRQGEATIGKKISAEVVRDKVWGNEKKTISADLLFGAGFSMTSNLLDEAMARGVITKDGSHFFFQGEKLCYGMPKMRELLKDEVFAEKVKNAIV